MFQWVKSELLCKVHTVQSFTRGWVPCLARALCLQLRKFATSSDCWAVPVLLNTCLDHDPKGEAKQTTPAVFSAPWLSDRLGFVCLTIDRVGNSWDQHVPRENTPYLKALQCSHLPLFAISTDTCIYLWLGSSHHAVEFSCWHRDWTCSQAEFLEAVRLLQSFSGHGSLKWAGWWLSKFCPSCVTRAALLCEGRL